MIMETQNQNPAVNVFPNGYGYGGGSGDMFGGGIFSWIILFFFFMMFMGWGNNGNANAGSGAVYPIQQGFDQAALVNGIAGVQNAVQNGFANAEVSRCNQQANLLAALNTQALALQNSTCENRANVADLKYTIATENCNDRQVVNEALQALSAQNNANMNILVNTVNAGIQALKDDNCALRLEQKDAKIADLERQLAFSQTSDLVNASRNAIIANNDLQTAAIEQYLAPTPRPSYIVQNPNCCSQNYYNTCCNRG